MNEKASTAEAGGYLRESAPAAAPWGAGRYAGNGRCRTCHEEVFRRWSTTAHAESYASLAAAEEETNAACLRCHTTGYGERQGFTDPVGTPGLAGVGCEACHGPSEDHARSAFPAIVTSGRDEDCSGCAVSRVCRRCHTRRHSPGFALDSALARVSCAMAPGAGSPGTTEGE